MSAAGLGLSGKREQCRERCFEKTSRRESNVLVEPGLRITLTRKVRNDDTLSGVKDRLIDKRICERTNELMNE